MTDDVKPPEETDDIVNDILNMLNRAGINDQAQLTTFMTEFTPYIVKREHKVLEHGMEIGRKDAAQT